MPFGVLRVVASSGSVRRGKCGYSRASTGRDSSRRLTGHKYATPLLVPLLLITKGLLIELKQRLHTLTVHAVDASPGAVIGVKKY